ncbi:hypothetical protein BH23BAC1_BH23BAC1_04080 [soil metagenome]
MTNFAFWENWQRQNKLLYFFILLIFTVSAATYLYAFVTGNDLAINWVVNGNWEKISVLVDAFQKALFDFEVYADNYLITESFSGSNINISFRASQIYLIFLGFALSLILAVFSVLPRFWYILGMAGFVFLITNFKIEQLFLFGRGDFIAMVIVFLLYLPISYFLHAIRPDVRFNSRVFIFIAITVTLGLLIDFFSEIEHPWLYLANYGLAGPVIISILFIFIVAHEIIAAFLLWITYYNNAYSKNSLLHFVALSVVYLFNVFLAYLHNTRVIDWNIFYLDAFLLLLISAFFGIWGFRKRSELFSNMLPMNGPGEILFLALGIICFSTIGYLFVTANDPIVETFEDAIIFSQFGFGIFFFIYVLVNFLNLLIRNTRVHRVVYKPLKMNFSVASVGGLAIIILMFFKSGIFPYYQAVAGYYNGIGDVYQAENDLYLAEQYYRLASGYEFQNHRSNYALASLATRQNDQATALYYFKQALLKQPTEHAYINLSNIYRDNARVFDAIFTLKDGLKIFPESGPIMNNLALLYNRLQMQDSSLYYFERSFEKNISKDQAQTNGLSIYVRAGRVSRPDTIPAFFQDSDYVPVIANRLILHNQEDLDFTGGFKSEIFADSVLNMNSFSYLNNYAFNNLGIKDSGFNKFLGAIGDHPSNVTFQETLHFLQALDYYYSNEVTNAFRNLDQMQATSLNASGYYNFILGTWSMEQHAPRLAAHYFEASERQGISEATINKGVALSLADLTNTAREFWSSLLFETNERFIQSASRMLRVINLDRDLTIPEESESFLYQTLIINYEEMSHPEVMDMVHEIHSKEHQNMVLTSIVDQAIRKGQIDLAEVYLSELRNLNNVNTDLEQQIEWRTAEILAARKEINALQEIVERLQVNSRHQEFLQLLFQALILEHNRDLDAANGLFRDLGFRNPFFERGVIEAARYFNEHDDELLSYEILRNAVEINYTSKELHKHFILIALESGLTMFAESALEDFRDLASPGEFTSFLKTYQEKIDELRQQFSDWD